MAKNGIFDEIKNWIPKFYSNGQWLKEDIELKYGGGKLADKEVVDFVGNLIHFLIEGTMLNNCTLIWLLSNNSTIKGAIEFYNSEKPKEENININTALSKIQYDRKKLEKYFDPKELHNLLAYPEKYLDKFTKTLDRLARIYMKDNEYNSAMVIKLSKEPLSYKLDDYSWAVLTSVIERYSKKKIKAIENGLDAEVTNEMIGYYNYLISNKRLNSDEKERLKVIRNLLDLE